MYLYDGRIAVWTKLLHVVAVQVFLQKLHHFLPINVNNGLFAHFL